VGINVQGDCGAGMPELSLDVFDIFPMLDEEARIGVSKIMKPDIRQGGFRERWSKDPRDHVVMINRSPCLTRKDEV